MSQTLLAGLEMAPRDPILGVTEAYNTDANPNKVNLGVGVYYDDNGKVPVLECVRRVELKLAESPLPRNYLPIDGIPAYDRAVQELVFGKDSPAVREQRVVTVQTMMVSRRSSRDLVAESRICSMCSLMLESFSMNRSFDGT